MRFLTTSTLSLLLLTLSTTSLASPDQAPAKPSKKPSTPAKSAASSSSTSSAAPTETFAPCTIRSAASGKFFDLNPLHVALPDPDKKAKEGARTESWHARGYDYGANFTINFCGGVVEDLEGGWEVAGGADVRPGVVGVEKREWSNVTGFYVKEGRAYSIGSLNTEPIIRGRKLVLNYTDGSPCPAHPFSDHHNKRAFLPQARGPKVIPGDHADTISALHPGSAPLAHKVEDVRAAAASPTDAPIRRKNTVISLLCEDEPTAPKVALAFLGSMDECSYFFELRSPFACPAVNVAKQQVGPSGVFGLIALIAILVYVVGGVVYQRAVMHQRGWRQLPNYALWAGIVGFVSDMVIILFSSCMRFVPFRRNKNGYGHADGNGYANGYGRSGTLEDENRMIDDLNEEWRD